MQDQISRAELDASLAHATGSESCWTHWTRRLLYTDGVRMMADKAGAHWLIDAIASHVGYNRNADPKRAPFQTWELMPFPTKTLPKGAVLTMREDSGSPILVRQKIPLTDFPLDGQPFTLWVEAAGGVPMLLLPGEH